MFILNSSELNDISLEIECQYKIQKTSKILLIKKHDSTNKEPNYTLTVNFNCDKIKL